MTTETIAQATKPRGSVTARLNKLRAAVLGANDGIVSVAATVIGVAAATPNNVPAIATAGFAALSAGAFSMATGEYISVSTQRDTERAIVDRVREGLSSNSLRLMTELTEDLQERGVSKEIAGRAAAEMYAADAIGNSSRIEGIDPDDLVNPWHAAFASFFAFIAGAALPIAAILLFPGSIRIPATFGAILVALALTGYISATLGDADPKRAMWRTVLGGALGMAVTYGVGLLFNVNLA